MNALDSILNIPVNSASRYWQKAGDAPASVTIITSEEIERYGYETLAEALQSVRGTYLSNDRNYTYLGLRGFSRPTDYNDRIILLINGHRINENVYGSCNVGNELGMNLEAVEKIEFVRGPGSSLYGTGAMFGVVNIVTKRGLNTEQLRVGAGAGSFGTVRGTVSYGEYYGNNVDLTFSGIAGSSGGEDLYFPEYDIPGVGGGIARDLDRERYTGMLAAVRYGGLTMQSLFTRRVKGIPTGAYGIVFNDPSAETVDETFHTGATYDIDADEDKKVTLQASYVHYYYKGTYPYETENTWDQIIGDQLMLGGHLVWDLTSTYRFMAGAEGIYSPTASYYNRGVSTVFFDRNVRSSIVSAYIHNDYQIFDDVKVVGGIRSDTYSEGGSYLAPRIGFVISPGSFTTVKMLYGEAFRAPNFAERYYEDANSGFKQSDRLKPERIVTYEAIVEQRFAEDYFATASVYRYFMEDLIDAQWDPADSLDHYMNVNAVNAAGVELGIEARYRSGAALYANYCYQRTVDKSTKLMLTNSPEHVAKAGVTFPVAEGVTASTEWRLESRRTTVYGTTTGPYIAGGLTLRIRTPIPDFECSVKIRNILDRRYALPGGVEHLQPAIEQSGRSVGLTINYSFRP